MNYLRISGIALVCFGVLNAAEQEWVNKSNEHAKVLLETMARFSPESAGRTGVDGLDEQISQISEKVRLEEIAAQRQAIVELNKRLKAETDARVRQDLEIMIAETERELKAEAVNNKLRLPYFPAGQMVFGGLRSLLDDQVSPERRKAAMVRLKKYTGREPGFTPITVQAEKLLREKLADKKLLGPFKSQVEQDLANSDSFINGLGQLFEKYKLDGYQVSYSELKKQVAAYNDFVRKEILPRTREDFRLPPELYRLALDSYGVDIPADQLTKMAHESFNDLQKQMNVIAARVTKRGGRMLGAGLAADSAALAKRMRAWRVGSVTRFSRRTISSICFSLAK